MKEVLTRWYQRYFSEEEAVVLLVMLVAAFVVMLAFGEILAPVFVAVILAYLMQGVANVMRHRGLPAELSVAISTLLFLGGFLAVLFGLAPLVWRQLVALVREAPTMIEAGRQVLVTLPEEYPVFFTQQQVNELTSVIQAEMAAMGQLLVTKGLSSIPSMLALFVYLILIPLMVFFFLKDRDQLIGWFAGFLPAKRPLLDRIWGELNLQFANYARGKGIEILIMAALLTGVCPVFPELRGAVGVAGGVVCDRALHWRHARDDSRGGGGVRTVRSDPDFYWVSGLTS